MTEREVLVEALQRTVAVERASYLDQACAGDRTLRQRVDELLAVHAEASTLLEEADSDREATAWEAAFAPADGTKLLATADDAPSAPPLTEPGNASGLPATRMPAPGDTLDAPGLLDMTGLPQYEILAELGRGGMGVVYKARHRRLNRIVALKMISDVKQVSQEARERFLIEGEVIARLRHPNIVQIYEISEAAGSPFVALEMLEGGSLANRLERTTQSGRAAAELAATLAAAIHAAHLAGVVHRDLKPTNIMFDDQGVPKIVDFGIAKRLEVDDGQTRTGQIVGTPSYMAPEQARGEIHKISAATDIHALGAVLYEMLTGRPPFKGSSLMGTLHKVVHEEAMRPSRIEPRIARDLETICLKCLEKDPQKRYSSALALAEDLRRHLDNRPIRARRTPLWERGVKWVRRHPTTAALTGLAAAAAITLAVFAVERDARIKARAREEVQRTLRVRADTERALGREQARLAKQDWHDGQLTNHLTDLLAALKREPGVGDLRDRAQQMLDKAQRGLRDEAEQNSDREKQRRFIERRNDAFFKETRYSGLDLQPDVRATRDAARAALEVYGTVRPNETWEVAGLPRTLSSQEQAEVIDDCYELLLVLADAMRQAAPGENRTAQADRALQILDLAVALWPQPTQTLLRQRAARLAVKKDDAGAARERAAADALRPATVLDHYLAGHEAYKRQDWKTALAEFETVLRMQPNHFWALALGAITSIQIDQPNVAKPRLDACITQEPGFAWLYLLRGYASAEQAVLARAAAAALNFRDSSSQAGVEQQFEAAEADYNTTLEKLELKPNDYVRWALLVNRAKMRSQRDRLDEAATDYQEAIRLKPSEYVGYNNLSDVLREQKKWDEAIERLTQAIKLKPELAALYRRRAAVQRVRDDPTPDHRAAELRDLEAAIRYERPGHLDLADDYTHRGELLRGEKRLDEALASCDQALKIAPDFDLAHRTRVRVLLELDRFDEVIQSCDGALAKGKPWPDIYEIRGLARASRGNYSGGIDDYSQALVLRPGQMRVLTERGQAYLASEAPRLALADFEQALRREPNNGEAHGGRGLALAMLGEHRKAVAEAEESLRLDSSTTARRAYYAARIYARAAATAASEVEAKGREAVILVDRYQNRAMALVRLAVERTPAARRAAFWQNQIAGDPAFKPLQRRLRSGLAKMSGEPTPPSE